MYLASQGRLASNSREIKRWVSKLVDRSCRTRILTNFDTRYESTGTEKKITQCELDLQLCDQAVAGAKSRITDLQKAVADGEKELSEAQSTLRNINDNIKFRESIKELSQVQAELDALDVEAAKKSHRRYNQDYERMRSDLGANQSEEARLGGEIATMEEDRKEKVNELETEYKDIIKRFNTELITNSVRPLISLDFPLALTLVPFSSIIDDENGECWFGKIC